MRQIDTSDRNNIVVLTGAGISVASGLRTFRGPNGMWEETDVERLAHVEMLDSDPDLVWVFYSQLRLAMRTVRPNAAHFALESWERKLTAAGKKFLLITQNIDALHQRAGSKNILEMHGGIFRTRCNNEDCPKSTPIPDMDTYDAAPKCSGCGTVLRPDIVLFGEMIPADANYQINTALRDCDLFIAIGTSGTVFPACDLVRNAKVYGARTILINPEKVPAQTDFDHYIDGKAEALLPTLLA